MLLLIPLKILQQKCGVSSDAVDRAASYQSIAVRTVLYVPFVTNLRLCGSIQLKCSQHPATSYGR